MKNITVGILAHVDAGKTTLSESMLYESGAIRSMGRVDNRDAFLDTDEQERARGITIFSKQAVLDYKDVHVTLIDTPGHVDFSAEMERALWIMDYAILVISGSDGVQGHTKTLWRMLRQYQIPVMVFINKMDQPDTDESLLMTELQKEFGNCCVDFSAEKNEAFYESVAVCNEILLEEYLSGAFEHDGIPTERMRELVKEQSLVPCFFGSALKNQGVADFLEGMTNLMDCPLAGTQQGARIYKIGRDSQGNRLTYLKVTGGILKVKDFIGEEKINQIRIYSGDKYEAVGQAEPGMVCAVTGLLNSYPGQGVGIEKNADLPMLEPVLTYTVGLPEDMDCGRMLPLLQQIEEEEPELQVEWQEETDTIQIKMMGPIQIQVLQKQIFERFRVWVTFENGKIVYKETIENKVEGVGHFEPLRHYAEVHLLLEPGEPGSGMEYALMCSEDVLDKNWQRLILTHLEEREHAGVLTGSPITDVKITVVGGRAHTKHTEGGDFRQATYRAVRQGLMQAKSHLLEPYYEFSMELPLENLGRAMTDVENLHGTANPPIIENERAVLTGKAPVSLMQDYQIEMNAYTKGQGILNCSLAGYGPCHNEEEILEQFHYNPDNDMRNPTGSVFCAHGAGFIVPWDQVKDYMHVDSVLQPQRKSFQQEVDSEIAARKAHLFEGVIDEEQIEEIIQNSSHKNQRKTKHYQKKRNTVSDHAYKGTAKPKYQTKYMIVDGYNILHAWDDFNCLLEDNLDGARARLMDILCNYQAYKKCELILVFDAYKVKGNIGEMFDYHNIHIVYTKEAETADTYIEKLTHQMAKDYYVTVATSDGLVQLITRGQNCVIMSARELREEIERINEEIRSYLSDD